MKNSNGLHESIKKASRYSYLSLSTMLWLMIWKSCLRIRLRTISEKEWTCRRQCFFWNMFWMSWVWIPTIRKTPSGPVFRRKLPVGIHRTSKTNSTLITIQEEPTCFKAKLCRKAPQCGDNHREKEFWYCGLCQQHAVLVRARRNTPSRSTSTATPVNSLPPKLSPINTGWPYPLSINPHPWIPVGGIPVIRAQFAV